MPEVKDGKWDFNGLSITREEVDYWISEVKLAREFRKKYFYDDDSDTGLARDCYNYYLGKQDILDSGLETPIVDNHIAPIVNAFIASFAFPNLEIIVKEKKEPVFPQQGEITKSVFNYFEQELKQDWHNQQVAFDAFITGIGAKTKGYNSEFEVSEEKEKIRETVKRKKGLGRGKGFKEVEEEIEREIVKRREWITKEFPFRERHSPFMFMPDPRAKSAMPYDGKYIVLEYDCNYNELKGNSNFENTEDLKPSGIVGSNPDKINFDDTRRGVVRVYQVQISKKDGLYILTLAKDYDKPLRYVKFPFEVEGFLTTFLTFNDTIDNFYPVPDVAKIMPLQDEVNYIQSKILEAIYKFLPKIGVNMDAIKDETEFLNAAEKGDIGTIMKFTKEPNASFQVMQFTLNLNDKLASLQMLKQEMRFISGVTEAELTGATDARTATEANIGARGFSARIIMKREKLRKFFKEDLRIFKQIVQQACDFPLITKITGLRETDPMTGELVTEQWVRLNRVKDYVVGEYELDLDLASVQQPNLELKRRQILESANFLFSPMVQQNLSLQGFKVDYILLIKEFLRTMEQFRNAPNLVTALSPEEKKRMAMNQFVQSGALNKMAQAPQGIQTQGAAQGEAQTIGEMTAGALGAL